MHHTSFLTCGVRKVVLPNGLTVLIKEMHDKPVVAAVLWYRVGSRNEELGQTGKSHFLEHMLFKGTDRYRKGEIDLITVSNGGVNNAFTWLDFTAYYFTFASDRWQVALEVESNRMRNTSFAPEEFESEKQVVQEELRIGLDGPWEALENEVWATAFRQHPYHWPTVGWLDDLESATAADMKAYYDRWYHPANACLVIAGDLNGDRALERIDELFGPIPPGPAPVQPNIVEPPQLGEKRVIVKKETPVERMLIGYHAPAVAHPDSYALQIVAALLATGKASRLYRRLVDKDQSVTLAKAHYNAHIDPSLFYIQAELKPLFKLLEVERAIYEEIEGLKNEPLGPAELEKAKRQIEADLVLSNEEPLQQAILLGQYETIACDSRVPEDSRGYRYLDTWLEKISHVSADDVARVAREYLNEDNRTVGVLIDPGSKGRGPTSMQAGEPPAARIAYRVAPSAPHPSRGNRHGNGHTEGLSLDVQRVELANGLVLLISESHSSPSVAINALVKAGSRLEPDEKAGLASVTGELLDEGTTNRTSEQIAEAVESAGGKLRVYGDYQSSGAEAAFLSRDFAFGLEIVSDLLMNAAFPEAKLQQCVGRRVGQIRSRLDVPRVQASDIFNELVFKGHPAHRPAIGYEATVTKLTREDVIEFFKRYYVPGNTILSIVGDVEASEVVERVNALLGRWEPAPGFTLPDVPAPVRQAGPIYEHVAAPKEQVNIFIGHLGIERKNPDYYALLVMDTILGSSPGFTSRIPRILRDEQGLAYTTFSSITSSAGLDPGRFIAYIGVAPENKERAISGLRGEITRVVREPVTAEELGVAKDYLTGSFVFDFQTNAQIATFLVDAETYQLGFDYLKRYPELIRSISDDDIRRASQKYIDPESLTTVVVGPVKERRQPPA